MMLGKLRVGRKRTHSDDADSSLVLNATSGLAAPARSANETSRAKRSINALRR
jgi:hypothetical protein